MWQPTSPTAEQAPDLETAVRARSASTKLKNPGRRFASIIKVRPECVEDYKAAHANVWPEVLKQIKDCGIEDCEQPQLCDPPDLLTFFLYPFHLRSEAD